MFAPWSPMVARYSHDGRRMVAPWSHMVAPYSHDGRSTFAPHPTCDRTAGCEGRARGRVRLRSDTPRIEPWLSGCRACWGHVGLVGDMSGTCRGQLSAMSGTCRGQLSGVCGTASRLLGQLPCDVFVGLVGLSGTCRAVGLSGCRGHLCYVGDSCRVSLGGLSRGVSTDVRMAP